jgi:hypothetical protein
MRERSPLLVVACLLAAVPLQALDLRWDGELRTRAVWMDNRDLLDRLDDNTRLVDSRLRLSARPVLSRDLEGLFQIEVGDVTWGEVTDEDGVRLGFGQGGEGYAVDVRQLFLDWRVPRTWLSLRVGLQPFAAPCTLVADSYAPALRLRWVSADFSAEALYAKCYLGEHKRQSYGETDARTIFSGDDRDDWLLAATLFADDRVFLTGWWLYDDNRRFVFADVDPYRSSLHYAGARAEGRVGGLDYDAHVVANRGVVVFSGGERPDLAVAAYAVEVLAEKDLDGLLIRGALRRVSGNDSDTNTIRQFQGLDGTESGLRTELSILFGGGLFEQQSLFDWKSPTVLDENLTSGTISSRDPGITAVELSVRRPFFGKLVTPSVALGLGWTSAEMPGADSRFLGTEIDARVRLSPEKGLDLDAGGAVFFPGKGAAVAVALREGEASSGGEDLAYKGEARIRLSF